MPIVTIRDLSGGNGINTDRHPTLLGPTTFTDALNVHFKYGALETRPGDTIRFQPNQPPEIPYWLGDYNEEIAEDANFTFTMTVGIIEEEELVWGYTLGQYGSVSNGTWYNSNDVIDSLSVSNDTNIVIFSGQDGDSWGVHEFLEITLEDVDSSTSAQLEWDEDLNRYQGISSDFKGWISDKAGEEVSVTLNLYNAFVNGLRIGPNIKWLATFTNGGSDEDSSTGGLIGRTFIDQKEDGDTSLPLYMNVVSTSPSEDEIWPDSTFEFYADLLFPEGGLDPNKVQNFRDAYAGTPEGEDNNIFIGENVGSFNIPKGKGIKSRGQEWFYVGEPSVEGDRIYQILSTGEHREITRRQPPFDNMGPPDPESPEYPTPPGWEDENDPGTRLPFNPFRPTEPLMASDYTEVGLLSDVLVFNNYSNTPQVFLPSPREASIGDRCINMPWWGYETVYHKPGQGEVETSPGSGVTVDHGVSADPEDPYNINLRGVSGTWHNWYTDIIRPYKNFLVCIGMNEDNVDYRQRVRWSAAALPNAAPPSWNAATLQTNAGYNDLSEATDFLVDGTPLGDSLILYTRNEVFQMDFVGGQDIMQFRKLFDEGGMLSRNCAVEFDGKHFVVGSNDVYIHDTSTKTSIADDSIRTELFSAISGTNTQRVRLFSNEARREIWIMYSSERWDDGADQEFPLDRAFVYDYSNRSWTKITLPLITDITIGFDPQSEETASVTWADLGLPDEYDPDNPPEEIDPTWDKNGWFSWAGDNGLRGPWIQRSSQAFGNQIIVASSHQTYTPEDPEYDPDFQDAFWQINADDTYTDGLLDRYIEKIGISVDQFKNGSDTSIYINKLLPLVENLNTGQIRVQITGTLKPNDPVIWDENSIDVIFNPNVDYKIDLRQTWQYLAYRIEFLDNETYRIFGLDMEIIPRGTRAGTESVVSGGRL